MEAGEGGGDGWGVREGRGGEKGRKLYLNDNKIRKYLTKKKKIQDRIYLNCLLLAR